MRKVRALAGLIALSPVLAHSDELIGVWEYFRPAVHMDETIRFTFQTDNQFKLYQNIVVRDRPLFSEDFPVDDGTVEVQGDGDLLVDPGFVVQSSGTWWTVGDSLFFDLAEADETLNRESLVTLLTQVGIWQARFFAEMLGYWPEPWAAYEEAVVAELIGDVERKFYFEGFSGPIGTYRIEHGKLWIINTWEDGTVAMRDFSRMDPVTAVTSSGWAAVKKGFQIPPLGGDR